TKVSHFSRRWRPVGRNGEKSLDNQSPKRGVVPRGGIEPPTHGFSVFLNTRYPAADSRSCRTLVASPTLLPPVRRPRTSHDRLRGSGTGDRTRRMSSELSYDQEATGRASARSSARSPTRRRSAASH